MDGSRHPQILKIFEWIYQLKLCNLDRKFLDSERLIEKTTDPSVGNRQYEMRKVFSIPKYEYSRYKKSFKDCFSNEFFDSDVSVLRNDRNSELQEDVYRNVFNFPQ